MGKSLYLGTYAGIPIYVHWTFGFVVLFIIYAAVTQGMVLSSVLWFSAYVLSLFVCVIFHEYGHALAAKRYGVITRDIIISPIGGVARMEAMPDKPWKELVIAIAGPLVNVVLAILLSILFYVIFEEDFISADFELLPRDFESFLGLVIIINIALFVFNLVPAFPMDGGRILRALLAMKWGRVKATKIASIIGRVLAVCFIGLAIWLNHPTLGFIGVFIFYMATMEMRQVKLKGKLIDADLSTIMEPNYTMLFSTDTIHKAIHFYKTGVARNFLVFDENQNPVGALPELFLQEYMQRSDVAEDLLLRDIMSSSFGYFDSRENLETVFTTMNQEGWSIAAIKNGDQLLAVVDRHMINSFLRA